MKDETERPEINMASIRVGGGVAGLIFAVGSTAVFVVGIPAVRYLLPASAVLGCLVAVALHFRREVRITSGIFSGRTPGR